MVKSIYKKKCINNSSSNNNNSNSNNNRNNNSTNRNDDMLMLEYEGDVETGTRGTGGLASGLARMLSN